MSKLIVLSNRVNLPSNDGHSAGGLAVALQDALREKGGIWLGWNGEKVAHQIDQKFHYIESNKVEYITCPLTEQQYLQFYCGFSNSTLWPAMHDRADLIAYRSEEFDSYQDVNQLFAQKLQRIAQPDDMIWVHDYHFLSVAHYCRELGMKNRFGFFLHIPFADLSIWEHLPVSQQLIQHLAEHDVVGLQTEHDQNNCIAIMRHYLKGIAQQNDSLWMNNHEVKVQCYPIGIDADLIQQSAMKNQDKIDDKVFKFSQLKQQKTIVAVDRIDYSKGLIERFQAYATFLKQNPEYQKNVTALQIACPCRMDVPAYQALFDQVQNSVSEINAQFSDSDWSAIHCTHKTIAHEQLMRIYRKADICWVNSMKDGMNLVAKEYIAAQDPSDPGVLILSKYAGAADQMPEAIIVDPKQPNSMINALKMALNLSKTERLQRYQQLIKGLKRFDIMDWRNAFIQDLKSVDSPKTMKQIDKSIFVRSTRH